VFSDHLDPTFAFRVSDAAAARAGLPAALPMAKWQIVDNDHWLLVHLEILGDAADWATRGRGLAGDAWAWAKQHAGAASGALGFVDLHALVDRVPQLGTVLACAKLAEPLGRVALSVETDLSHVAVHATVDVGAAASSVAGAILPPPPGWAATAKGAPVAMQLNLDLEALSAWSAPCTHALGLDHVLAKAGVRAGRAMLQSIDIAKPSGTGAIALDLDRKDALAKLLDRIPMRSTLESDRTFGGHAGHHVDIPFTATIDYVLEDHLALAAMGDGLLDRITAAPAAAPSTPPLFAVDIWPSKLPHEAWQALAQLAHVPAMVADRLAALTELQTSLSLTGSTLALDVSLDR
jgi:hypothetical protein